MQLSQAIRRFLEDCELAQGLAPRTIENYEHYLGRFLDFTHNINVGALTDEHVRTYRLKLNERELSRATQNYHLVALRALLGWLAKQNIRTLSSERIDLPGAETIEVNFLDREHLAKLLAAPNLRVQKGKRDQAILETLFSTGLRVAELVRLDRQEVENREEVSVVGKGRKRRVVFLSPGAQSAIKTYVAARTDDDPALFVRIKRNGESGGRLTPRTIQRLIQGYAAQAGLAEHVTPHTLRHSFGTDLLRSGADLRSVQALLGHSSVATTQRYTHLTDQHLHEVHKAFHGRKRINSK
ncbi:tyrosine-type recombinase/integrase [Candidatus Berkelbacteria bacterium]|nr:tyrosine-type recombinase/integrase [Candidatus Berkelbacteria bacterium]